MARNLRPIASLLLAVALLLAGNGLQFTLLPLRGQFEGFSTLELGVLGSAYYIGFVSGCLIGPYAILRAGHIRAFAAMVAIAAASTLAYALVPYPLAWSLFRLISGLALAGFYLVIESWLNDGASNENRGYVMSSYVAINFGAIVAGQMLLTLYPIGEDGNFMVAAILCSLAIVPVALTRSAQPAPITLVSFRPWPLYEAAPVALIGTFLIGVANGAFWGLAPVSAAGSGLGQSEVATFMGVAVLAGALTQWPVGRLSDRFDRRLVLMLLLMASAAAGIALWTLAATGKLLMIFGFVFGGLTLPGYSLAAAHAYDKTPASDMVATAATLLLVNGLGSAIGPLAGAMFLSREAPRKLFLFIAVVEAVLAVYIFYRMRVQAASKPVEKTGFDLGATAPFGAVVTTETLDPEDPSVAVPEEYTPPPAENASRS